jgi:hypothetical protein
VSGRLGPPDAASPLPIAAGVNAKALSTYTGHSSIKVTFDLYGHLMPGAEAEAAGLLDAYLALADTDARKAAVAPDALMDNLGTP